MGLVAAGQRITASVLNQHYTQTDNTTRTVTSASLTQISGSFSLAANELAAGDAFEIECWGGGTQGSTQQNLTYKLTAFGADSAAGTMLGTVIPASQNFRWYYKGILMVLTTGALGTSNTFSDFRWSQASVNHSATLGANGDDTGGPSIDTTSATSAFLKVQWASTTGAPTINCIGSFIRLIRA